MAAQPAANAATQAPQSFWSSPSIAHHELQRRVSTALPGLTRRRWEGGERGSSLSQRGFSSGADEQRVKLCSVPRSVLLDNDSGQGKDRPPRGPDGPDGGAPSSCQSPPPPTDQAFSSCIPCFHQLPLPASRLPTERFHACTHAPPASHWQSLAVTRSARSRPSNPSYFCTISPSNSRLTRRPSHRTNKLASGAATDQSATREPARYRRLRLLAASQFRRKSDRQPPTAIVRHASSSADSRTSGQRAQHPKKIKCSKTHSLHPLGTPQHATKSLLQQASVRKLHPQQALLDEKSLSLYLIHSQAQASHRQVPASLLSNPACRWLDHRPHVAD